MRRSRMAVVLGAGVLGALLLGVHARGLGRELARPLSFEGAAYAGSNECRRCHPSNHASWYRTFHRTMTQEATPESVVGDFASATFDYGGIRARMYRVPAARSRSAGAGPPDDSGFRMELSGPDPEDGARFTIARTVGSRRYQQYLTVRDGVYVRLPVAWNIEERRWMHMNGAFLTPDPPPPEPGHAIARADYDRHVARWNDNCIFCHNVAPRPGLDPLSGTFDTSVAELGIACEACHGPGGEHVRSNRDPLRRFALHLGRGPDPTIANPRRLSPQRSAEICGRCHGQRLSPDIERVQRDGDRFRPGEALGRYSHPLWKETTLNGEPGTFAARFWSDGTPRLTAYEYQGLLQSACTQRGALTCTSCHSMHAGDPRGQLDPSRPGDALCTGCHASLAGERAQRAHTHHPSASEGARCVSCHMPRVVYGLIGAHRSHRIDVPTAVDSGTGTPLDGARPDACVLCHADKSRAWVRTALARWYEAGSDERVNAEDAEAPPGEPAVTELLFAGDPIQRALAADALGRGAVAAPSHELARRAGLLAAAMRGDDYPAVRAIAWRSLRAVLAAQPGRVPAASEFTATDSAARRAGALDALIARLPPSTFAPPPLASAGLRPAATAPIFIGE